MWNKWQQGRGQTRGRRTSGLLNQTGRSKELWVRGTKWFKKIKMNLPIAKLS